MAGNGSTEGTLRSTRHGVVVGGLALAVATTLFLSALCAAEPSAAEAEPIVPIPLHVPLDTKKVSLGDRLFHDPRLSRDGSVSCAHCHDLGRGGTDRRQVSVGIGGAQGAVNAPTVLNSGLNFRQFWDGRARTLEEQIDGPIHNPAEMGTDWAAIVAQLEASPPDRAAFAEIYADAVTPQNIREAISTFERSLYTPNGRFDRFLRGDADAITAAEKEGYAIFKSYGCVSCHQGIGVGGNMYQTFGVMADYFAGRQLTTADLGRFNVTGDPADRHVFKVPSLRNVALTAPYFHDGSADRLEDAVAMMASYQLGRDLSEREVDLIVRFLQTLTGDPPRRHR